MYKCAYVCVGSSWACENRTENPLWMFRHLTQCLGQTHMRGVSRIAVGWVSGISAVNHKGQAFKEDTCRGNILRGLSGEWIHFSISQELQVVPRTDQFKARNSLEQELNNRYSFFVKEFIKKQYIRTWVYLSIIHLFSFLPTLYLLY